MFGKKCPKCKRKIERSFAYCPFCGLGMRKKDGLLDSLEEMEKLEKKQFADVDNIETLTKEIGRSMGVDFDEKFPFKQIINKLSKDIEKQFKDTDKEIALKREKNVRREMIRKEGAEIERTNFPGGFSIQIRIGGTPTHMIRMPSPSSEEKKKFSPRKFSDEELKKIAKLPREEAATKVRRLTDRIIYEINLPGVDSLKDIIINKLENSIEIKAISKDRAYFKLISVNLPLLRYYLQDGKLFLELKPQG